MLPWVRSVATAEEPADCDWSGLKIVAQLSLQAEDYNAAAADFPDTIQCMESMPAGWYARTRLSDAYSGYGDTLRGLRRFDDAIAAYTKAEDLARKPDGDTVDLARAVGGIGKTLLERGDQVGAEAKLKAALLTIPNDRRDYVYIDLQHSLVSLYAKFGRWTDVINTSLETIRFIESNTDLFGGLPEYYRFNRDLGRAYAAQSDLSPAEAAVRKAIDIAERQQKSHRNYMWDIGRIVERDQRYFDKIAPVGRPTPRGRQLQERAAIYTSPNVAEGHQILAELYMRMDRTDDAERLLRMTISAYELAGEVSIEYVTALRQLSEILRDKGECGEVLELLSAQIKIIEREFPGSCPGTCTLHNDLAFAYICQGRFAEALGYLEQAVEEMKGTAPLDELDSLTVELNRARLLLDLGRGEEALPIVRRIRERLGQTKDDSPARTSLARSARLLAARILLDQGNTASAIENMQELIADVRATGNPSDIADLAEFELAFAEILVGSGEFVDAKEWLVKALDDLSRIGSKSSLHAAEALQLLVVANMGLGVFDDGEAKLKEAIAIAKAQLSDDHPGIARLELSLGAYYLAARRTAEAEAPLRQAVQTFRNRGWLLGLDEQGETAGEFQSAQEAFKTYLAYLMRRMADDSTTVGTYLSPSFEMAQLVRATTPSEALLLQSIERNQTDAKLVGLHREHRDLLHTLAQLEQDVLRMVRLPEAERNKTAETTVRTKIASASVRIAEVRAILGEDPRSRESVLNPPPLPITTVQKLLRPGEALVLYLIDRGGTGAWVVRSNEAQFKLLPETEDILAPLLSPLRASLSAPEPSAFDVNLAHAAHDLLIAPLMENLGEVDHVYLVPDGILQTIPIGVFVKSAAPNENWKSGDYREIDWLASRYAVSVLPSASSLALVAGRTPNNRADLELLGFGNPQLGDHRQAPGSTPVILSQVGGVANCDAIAQLPPIDDILRPLLPQTARALGLGSNWPFIVEGGQATEFAFRRQPLKRFRTIVLATHGISVDKYSTLPIVAEPALILSPPEQGGCQTSADDGLLTASEIESLRFEANVVLLIACSTASGGDDRGAEAFAGLAKAFFLAGARSVVASYWDVNAQASAAIVTMAAARLHKGTSRSFGDALNEAALAVAHTDELFSHPHYWAPFAIAGNGNALYEP
ncbi:CHAT domain-containing tetratricopeptide repeat protein [Paracoccus actinidiae]|uniref:CHAT domain-containing tetratricopeptide repeat protein n=1 Tax=Paracoccus actinidiae TaxID=3064531 RepID=UPI0027D24477|nr:CHAT domain-containing tetratricopeptide repeat protein [Paracoccus sp. M09]